MSILNGKRVIFIGDSFIFYGQAVIRIGCEELSEEKRLNDKGYFYHLCRENGDDVSVTNWTFGGHGLDSILADACPLERACKGVNHFSLLTDKHYDYVIMSGGRRIKDENNFLSSVERIIGMFKEANPNVKLVYLVSSGAHNVSVEQTHAVKVLNNLVKIEKMGVTVVDWGKLIRDIICGEVKVLDSNLKYTKNTFVVSRIERDGFHPNQLAGYITSLMTYCAITGASAVGQPYAFATDKDKNPLFCPDTYVKNFYEYSSGETNYRSVFDSPSEMRALQLLVDKYLNDKKYRKYNFKEG